MDKEKLQEKYMELQIIEQQMKQIQKQIQLIEAQILELTTADEALGDLKDVKPGTNILVPISNGVFIKAAIKDNENLIVNVGAGITVGKDRESAKDLIKQQLDEINEFQEKMTRDLHKLGIRGNALQEELQKMISENV